ncbi:MAG: phosphoribosylamine--glycine ligase [Bacillota bacterium]|nr:phosphoribosylamine--glycine ligase [Bacillota bacterium]
MDILVVGGGGREHAIIKKLRESPDCGHIYALPGNGGIAAEAECVPVAAKDIEGIISFAAAHDIGLAVVAPDDPLVLGAVDGLERLGITCFGPNAAAAQIEGSKGFAKRLMQKYHIPTAAYAEFSEVEPALAYAAAHSLPLVVKADGLALGKGVFICEDLPQAEQAIRGILERRMFGASGDSLIIEEHLSGPEASVLAFTDGESIAPMVSSMDHKRIGDGDAGPNTGGMGTVAPNPFYTPQLAAECMERIFLPTVRGMAAEGRPFKGCLYFGLMLTAGGPKVIEYNCRFGDPEAQVVLPLLQSDLLQIMLATARGKLAQTPVRWSEGAACCVVLASGGYPRQYQTGYAISDKSDGVTVYHAGTKLDGGQLVTSGGRVLGVTAVADDLAQAVDKAYAGAARISFEGAYYRKDIGQRALSALNNV